MAYTLNPLLDWFATQSFLVTQEAGPVARPMVGKNPFRMFNLLPNAYRRAPHLDEKTSVSSLSTMLLTNPSVNAVSLYLPIEWPYAQPLSASPIFEEYRVTNTNGVTLGDILSWWSEAQCCVSKGLPVCLRIGPEGGDHTRMEEQLRTEYYQLLNVRDMWRNLGDVRQQMRDTRRLVRDMRRELLQNDIRPENGIEVLKAWEELVYQRGEEWLDASKHAQDDHILRLNKIRAERSQGYQSPTRDASLSEHRLNLPSRVTAFELDFVDGLHLCRL